MDADDAWWEEAEGRRSFEGGSACCDRDTWDKLIPKHKTSRVDQQKGR